MSTAPITVVVVDDQSVVRRGIIDLLSQQPDILVCGEASSTAEALQVIAAQQPAVVIVDIMIGAESGLDLVQTLAHDHPSVRVLVMSPHGDGLFAERALRAGALGYLTKSANAGELQASVRLVAAGQTAVSDSVSAYVVAAIARSTRGGSPLERLSNRELHVFTLIGQGKSTREVAAHLGLSVKTIETYHAKIKQKLGLRGSRQLTHAAVTWWHGSQT